MLFMGNYKITLLHLIYWRNFNQGFMLIRKQKNLLIMFNDLNVPNSALSCFRVDGGFGNVSNAPCYGDIW